MEKNTSNQKSVDPMLVLGKAVDMSLKVRGGDFPLGALPMKIQRIVREANDCYGYPVDYLAGAMLVTVGLGLGNTHFARLKGKWDEMENPGADDPCGQVDLTPEAKIGLPPLPKIKMTPVDIEPPGDFICIFGFRFGRRGIKPKKHEYKVKKHSPVSRIGNGNKKHQQCF